jgi:hypothetical protein
MERFVEGVDRGQGTLFPERLEDWIGADNPVRVIEKANSARLKLYQVPSPLLETGERQR